MCKTGADTMTHKEVGSYVQLTPYKSHYTSNAFSNDKHLRRTKGT